ncbi:hypothetical protein [Candidatus Phyllobacterium onerii]|uniref:hypothetical protein n=1 Tax=Candidatus Phyllobacterium onerii TaxID=3020828 RepID=UPI00232EF355|nr:hypothetical protein [Phyllobacterium sp. IY22]
MSIEGSKTYIAGRLSGEDWKRLKEKLAIGGEQEAWASAYEDYFLQRLKLRYLDPIKVLDHQGAWEGEGFSIVSIQCALIEFLSATRRGEKYRFLKRGETLGPHEYSSSSALFQDFLSSVPPFSSTFDDASAKEFYQSIRCALLHEARTRNGWRLWVSGTRPIDLIQKIVYRKALQAAISLYLEDYGTAILSDPALQAAFIRKFDDLAD